MRRNIISLTLVAAILLSGCIEYREVVSLNKDGSGTVDIHFALSGEYLKQMNELMKMTEKFSGEEAGKIGQPSMIATKSEIEEFLIQSKSNVKLLDYETPDSSSGGAIDVKFSFSSIAELDIAAASLFPDDNPSPGTEKPSASFIKADNGTWLFTRAMQSGSEIGESMEGGDGAPTEGENSEMFDGGSFPGGYPNEESDGGETEDGADDAENVNLNLGDFAGSDMEALAREMEKAATDTANPAIEFTISFPGKIINSNASIIDGSKATWRFTLQQITDSASSMTATIAD